MLVDAACYSSCFSQHKKHPKKLSNTSVKDKALGFQLHQQPRQLLSVFLVLQSFSWHFTAKAFLRPWHVAETHTTMGIITMHTLTKIQQKNWQGTVYCDTASQNAKTLN